MFRRVASAGMTGLMDKIRAVLGRRGPQPGDADEALGPPATEGSEVPAGEPTLGAALGMNIGGLLKGSVSGTEPDADATGDRDGR
jgi:hypothetical protein